MGHLWFWLAVVAYSLLVIGIGAWIRLRRSTTEGDADLEFWIARRELPGWRLGISLTSGWLMLGWIGFGMSQIYMFGATALWILTIPWFLLCFIIVILVPYVRRLGAVSLPQAIEQRYGRGPRVVLAILSALVFLSWTQAELFMAGTLMKGFLGVEPWVCMLLLVIPIIFYTLLGGFRAIVSTDLVQFIIMAAFMVILAVVALREADHATSGAIWKGLEQATPPWSAKGKVFDFWFLGSFFPIVLLVGYLPGWMIEQDLTLRIQAARSTREARRGALLSLALISVFVLALPTLAAFAAIVVFPPVNGAPPAILDANATSIIAAFIARMSTPIQVFMLLGLVACQMSTVDTFTNVTSMPIAFDFLAPMVKSPRARGRLARGVSVVVIILAFLCAMISDRLGDVYYISSGVLSASIALPALFIFWRRTSAAAVVTAAITGALGTMGGYYFEYKVLQAADAKKPWYYTEYLPSWLHGSFMYNYVAAGVIISLITLTAVSLIFPCRDAERQNAVRAEPIDDYETFVQGLIRSAGKE